MGEYTLKGKLKKVFIPGTSDIDGIEYNKEKSDGTYLNRTDFIGLSLLFTQAFWEDKLLADDGESVDGDIYFEIMVRVKRIGQEQYESD